MQEKRETWNRKVDPSPKCGRRFLEGKTEKAAPAPFRKKWCKRHPDIDALYWHVSSAIVIVGSDAHPQSMI